MKSTRLVLLSICIIPAVAQAHNFISTQFIAGEKAIQELQARRDTIIDNSAASDPEKQAAQAYVATAFDWNKLNLSVCFWQVDDPQFLEAVKAQANLWTKGTRVQFNFGDGVFRRCQNEKSADIRVTFKQLAPSFYAMSDRPLVAWDWSEYGNLPSQLSARVSMSLVHAPEDYKLATTLGKTVDFNFLVAHEFGHALGLLTSR